MIEYIFIEGKSKNVTQSNHVHGTGLLSRETAQGDAVYYRQRRMLGTRLFI
jgi:hypothetical protein